MGNGTRRVAIVTGGNSGVGRECARSLAAAGWQVVLARRNQETAAAAVGAIAPEAGNGAVDDMPLDLASFASIRRFAVAFAERGLATGRRTSVSVR